MLKETPKERLIIPDTCSSIVLNINSCAPQRFFDYIQQEISSLNIFKGGVTVDSKKTKGEDHNDRQIEIKRNPQIPLVQGEKEFLEKMAYMEGVEILFY